MCYSLFAIMIIPAIIAKDKEELQEKISQLDGLVSSAQIDVMDGVFTRAIGWNNPADLDDIKAGLHLEAHLMISHPEQVIDRWVRSPIRRILLHHESTDSATLSSLVKTIINSGKSVGVVLKMQTPLWVLDELLSNVIYQMPVVQLMGIDEIGYYGNSFNAKVLERAVSLREKYPNVTLQVDGGVSLKNAPLIVRAGVDNLVVGSAIFKSGDVKGTIEKFQNIIQRFKI